MRRNARASAPTAAPTATTGWMVTVLADPHGVVWVGDPTGLTALAEPARGRVSRAGGAGTGTAAVTWAWGRVPADAPTPRVVFRSRTLRRHPAVVRRLTPTLWSAQAAGRWPRVRVR